MNGMPSLVQGDFLRQSFGFFGFTGGFLCCDFPLLDVVHKCFCFSNRSEDLG
jgi:hypothetical protein